MTDVDTDTLREDLESYRAEREQIRSLVGQIGGAADTRRDRALNIIFIVLVLGLFAFDIVQHFALKTRLWPVGLSLELALLLVSIKIIWMIHQQSRVEHFQFWILNSIEFRLNEMSRRFNTMEKKLNKDNTDQ
ncbi:MAG: hypothetical protein ACYS8X_03890 [Planctomycetota bacterium]